MSCFLVPPRQEVQDSEDDGHRRRDEQDGSHRLLHLLLGRHVTSGLPSLLRWLIGEQVVALEVGEHGDVEQLGAGSGAERVEAGSESALESAVRQSLRLVLALENDPRPVR